MSKAPPSERKCPKCGARLAVERVDHHLSGSEKLLCPKHGPVGYLDDNRGRSSPRRGDVDANDD